MPRKTKTEEKLPEVSPEQMRRHVRIARQSLGWTQAELAAKTGLSQSKLSLYESGQVGMSDEDLEQVWVVLERRLGGKAGPMSALLQAPGVEGEATDKSSIRRQRRARRQGANMSQHELARKIGIGRSKLSQWELGNLELTSEERQRWERELTISDPYFQIEVHREAGRELFAANKKLREENAALRAEINILKAQFLNCEEIAALRHAQIEELAERLERLQSPLVKKQ